MWVSPKFSLQVIRAYDAMVTGGAAPAPSQDPQIEKLAAMKRSGILSGEDLRAAAFQILGLASSTPEPEPASEPGIDFSTFVVDEELARRRGLSIKAVRRHLTYRRFHMPVTGGGYRLTALGSDYGRLDARTGLILWDVNTPLRHADSV